MTAKIELCYLERQTGRQMKCGNPWEAPRSNLPKELVRDKAKRAEWLQSPENAWVFYSGLEGIVGNARISRDNLPYMLRGIVADYDLVHSAEEIESAVAIATRRPSLMEWSITPGKWRAIWLLDKPLMVPPSIKLLSKFVEEVTVKKLKGDALGRGRDPKSGDAAQVFAVGQNGVVEVENDDGTLARLPRDLVQGWLMDYMKHHPLEVSRDADRLLTPEVVAPMLLKKYPAFSEWPGDFVEGAQGPTFWVEGSKSPLSAKVHKTGIYTWSATAQEQYKRAWWSWADLLGESVLDEFKATRQADLVKDVYYDGQLYHVWKPEASAWITLDRDAMKTFLRSRRGVRMEKGKNEASSEMDDCLTYVHEHAHVAGAAPFLYRGERLISSGGATYLNTGNRRLALPALGPHSMVWGDGFPMIARIVDQIYDCHHWELDGTVRELTPEESKRWGTLLGHHARWVQAMRDLRPCQGQAVIIAGPTGCGKSLFAHRVLGGISGGYSEASRFLKGDDPFGAELFQTPLWCVDDGSFSTDYAQGKKFTDTLKSIVANPERRWHQKFKQAAVVNIEAMRVFISMNDDDKSLIHAPLPESSNLDKIILIRASRRSWKYPERAQLEAQIASELPAFTQFLLDLDWRALGCLGVELDSRFGVHSVRDDHLLRRILRVGYNAGLYEVLYRGLEQWFDDNQGQRACTMGTMDLLTYFDRNVSQFRAISSGGRASPYVKWQNFLIGHRDTFPGEIDCNEDARGTLIWTFPIEFVERGHESAKPLSQED